MHTVRTHDKEDLECRSIQSFDLALTLAKDLLLFQQQLKISSYFSLAKCYVDNTQLNKVLYLTLYISHVMMS